MFFIIFIVINPKWVPHFKNFARFTGKHLCQSLLFNKVTGICDRPEACNFFKKETLAQAISFEFCKISKNTFFIEHLRETASISGVFANIFQGNKN